jgi:hypothetical protein
MWIGIIRTCSDTRCSAFTTGTMRCSPGRRGPSTRPSRNNTPSWYRFTTHTHNTSPSATNTTKITTAISETFMTMLSW